MEKLSLIVPLSLISISLVANDGVDGCHIQTGTTMQSRLYHIAYSEGAGSPTEWIQDSKGGGGYNRVTDKKCFENTSLRCKVYDYGTKGISPPSSAVIYSGNYAVVTTNCPIDNYVLLLFLFTTGFAILRIKKQCHFANENIHHHRRIQWSRFYRRVY